MNQPKTKSGKPQRIANTSSLETNIEIVEAHGDGNHQLV